MPGLGHLSLTVWQYVTGGARRSRRELRRHQVRKTEGGKGQIKRRKEETDKKSDITVAYCLMSLTECATEILQAELKRLKTDTITKGKDKEERVWLYPAGTCSVSVHQSSETSAQQRTHTHTQTLKSKERGKKTA